MFATILKELNYTFCFFLTLPHWLWRRYGSAGIFESEPIMVEYSPAWLTASLRCQINSAQYAAFDIRNNLVDTDTVELGKVVRRACASVSGVNLPPP